MFTNAPPSHGLSGGHSGVPSDKFTGVFSGINQHRTPELSPSYLGTGAWPYHFTMASNEGVLDLFSLVPGEEPTLAFA